MNDEPLTSDSRLGAVISGFAEASGAGRELRAALSHVDAELGSMPVRNVRPRHVSALLDDLEDAGISPRRATAVADALAALFAFAHDRGLVVADPVPARLRNGPEPAPVPVTVSGPATPTATMVALGARAAAWTGAAIVVVFLLLLATLLAELA